VKILVLTNLYPPYHGGTFDLRCESVTEALRLRGHSIRVLTSTHGIKSEQINPEIQRRLWLNNVYGHPCVRGLRELKALEVHNHVVLKENIQQFQPDLVYVWSLHGLSKSLVFTLRNSRHPVVYDVSDYWLAREIRQDPWLRWWNSEKLPFVAASRRILLELAGTRGRLDQRAPTRISKGYDRLPSVYGLPSSLAQVQPNSIGAFRFDRLYFCSRALKEASEQAGFRVNHAEVIYPGIPTEIYVGDVKPKSAPVTKVLLVTRLNPESGALTAVRALLQILENNTRMSLSIYGRGETDYMAELRSFIVSHKLPVEFLTVSNINKDLAALYRQHDVLVYTSEWDEPFALTPLEAMASGLPVIGSNVGGARELFRHRENALTYTAGDFQELAGRLQEIKADHDLRVSIAETGQTMVLSKHNQTAVTDQIENYLETSRETWQES